ncbi:MAG: polysaccharide pyruvyl transferase family protein [Deltaproteobacteria bacterium]|nr:polysaccharide pyruvyl transferase family protein [Deltaproteobacteria bacterium]
MPRIGFLGAFSIDNAGDALVGLATRQQVLARIAAEPIVLAPTPRARHYRVDTSEARGLGLPIRAIAPGGPPTWSADLDALVIGGGGILSLDDDFAAVVEWGGVPAAWNSLCAQNAPWYLPACADRYRAIRDACARLAFLSVRNRSTARFLRGCGVTEPIALAPDPAIALALPSPVDGAALLAEAGLGARPVVGISVGGAIRDPRAAACFDQLLPALDALDADLLLFPFGNIYGDDDHQRLAATRLRRARRFPRPLGPLELWALIGALDLHVATRLHGLIAAYAQATPVVVLDEYLSDLTGTSKIREFVVERELEDRYICPYLGHHATIKLALAWDQRTADRARLAAAAALDRAALADHFDRLVAALAVHMP